MFNKLFSLNSPSTEQRFQLLRNFSIVSLSTFVLATSLLAIFYRRQAVHDLVISTEESNITTTQIFANTLWPKYGYFLSSTQSLSDEALVAHPKTRQLYKDTLQGLEGSQIAKIKVFDLQGRTVFSTDESQTGDDKSQSSGFVAARSGQVVSQLDHRDTFAALQTTLEDRNLLSSYIPIRGGAANAEIVGVFELYKDVTPLVERIEQTQRRIILGSLLILTSLYGLLYLFVKRADYLLEQQYQRLQASEGRYRQQAGELEDALSELRQAQLRLIQNEKMSSLGNMVAGVAHEINNPVSFIHGNLNHLRGYGQNLLKLLGLYQHHYPHPQPEIQAVIDEVDLPFIQDDLPKILTSMDIGSKRIREIVLALRIFSRLDEADIKSVDIHQGLDSTLMILQHRFQASSDRPAIQVVKDYATLRPVECYAGLLNQVFMNILVNALDAIADKTKNYTAEQHLANPGRITLQTSVIDQEWVQITIADNGLGIPAEIKERIFEPFFTTKAVGKGTGMGMSISYQIITERHRGKLECFSTPGQGTKFAMQIPIQQPARPKQVRAEIGSNERIPTTEPAVNTKGQP
ncbi:MAG: ATP-binding protein [Cyanobacteria bacterium P01_H01_bin.162]